MLVALAMPGLAAPDAGTKSDAPSTPKYPVYEPAKTTVLVLPVVNQTGKQQGKEENEAAQSAMELMMQVFDERGFAVVAATDVAAYIAKEKIDLKDEDVRTKGKLLEIGKALNANIVICAVLQELSSSTHMTILSTRKVGKAKMQAKLVDVATESYLINDAFSGSKKGSVLFPGLEKSKSTRIAAVGETVSLILDDLLKPYKVTKKADGDKAEDKKSDSK